MSVNSYFESMEKLFIIFAHKPTILSAANISDSQVRLKSVIYLYMLSEYIRMMMIGTVTK